MAQYMIDNIAVTRTKIYKGAARLVVADSGTSFPGRLESVMQPSTPADAGETAYALAADWSDLGPTSEDGVVLRREAELSDGIPIDQRTTNLDEGEPENWTMEAEFTLIHTDLDTIAIGWEGGTNRGFSADGTHVAQHALDLDAPSSFTERLCAFIQEDPNASSGKLRVFVFRKGIPQVDGTEMNLQAGEAAGLPVKMKLKADTDIAEGSGQFGKIFEED